MVVGPRICSHRMEIACKSELQMTYPSLRRFFKMSCSELSLPLHLINGAKLAGPPTKKLRRAMAETTLPKPRAGHLHGSNFQKGAYKLENQVAQNPNPWLQDTKTNRSKFSASSGARKACLRGAMRRPMFKLNFVVHFLWTIFQAFPFHRVFGQQSNEPVVSLDLQKMLFLIIP